MRMLVVLLLPVVLLGQSATEKLLLEKIAQLEARIAALEGKKVVETAPVVKVEQPEKTAPPNTTVGVYVDGYYGYNFNRPASGTNQLRAYDVTHNGFTLSQGTLVVEHKTKYLGGRVDLQFGQATQTLQGSSVNEPRPAIYRNIFQAYGTVYAPVGKGLTLDFGKFAGSLGLETNYTKDQLNYSRSYFFNFLPYYHMGLRATYPVNDKFAATYWLVNGANQTEDFNASKSQAAILTFKPTATISGNVNYYDGREGMPGDRRRFRVFDTYWTWNITPKAVVAAELDAVTSPEKVWGGALYGGYRIKPRWQVAARYERLTDKGGLFSGTRQTLREVTLTSTFEMVEGFQMRWEYRRDSSNHNFFEPGQKSMDTAMLGLIWWFGTKQGTW